MTIRKELYLRLASLLFLPAGIAVLVLGILMSYVAITDKEYDMIIGGVFFLLLGSICEYQFWYVFTSITLNQDDNVIELKSFGIPYKKIRFIDFAGYNPVIIFNGVAEINAILLRTKEGTQITIGEKETENYFQAVEKIKENFFLKPELKHTLWSRGWMIVMALLIADGVALLILIALDKIKG